MTREEEIQKLIDEENGIVNYGSCDYQVGVCDGVRLADNTMIDKSCKWLLDNTGKYMIVSGGGYWFNDIEFIKDFKRYLEE